MKKFLFSILTILLLQNHVYSAQTNISFVYINGSNNNDEKMKTWYENGVKKHQPTIIKKFEKNRDTKRWFNPDTGIYHINEAPVIFFWGDRSKNDLDFVKRQLDISKALSPTLAYHVRNMLTQYLHDAIWVQKTHNMNPIIDNLNDIVKEEYKKGNEVILYGYSAGTFVTHNYLLNKLPYLNLKDLFGIVNVSENIRDFIESNPQDNTCISALADARIGVVSSNGHLLLDNSEDFKTKYIKLNASTERVCAPKGAVKGVINFASPLVLFYSDMADPNYEYTYYNKLMLKYMIENGLFFLTINFREDPLGFPSSRNLSIEELEQISGIKFENPKGFVYDNSSVWSKRSCLFAHTSYWSAKNTFANAIVKTLVKGIRFNYNNNYQIEILEKTRE